MERKLVCCLLITCGCVLSQETAPRAAGGPAVPGKPAALVWLNSLDPGGKEPERLARLSPDEFSTAVAYLEEGQETFASARMVLAVALNYKRMQHDLPLELRDRAAAALVKATEIEDKNLRLQNLHSLSGVDHPLVREMLARLSGSDHEYTAQTATKNLQTLDRPSGAAPTPARPERGTPSSGDGENSPQGRAGKPGSAPPPDAPGNPPGDRTPDPVSAKKEENSFRKPVYLVGGLILLLAGYFLGRGGRKAPGPP